MKISQYFINQEIVIDDKMQSNYTYWLEKEIGDLTDGLKNFGFEPQLTPQEMLNLGVFEGKYLNDCFSEFPEEWLLTSKKKRSEIANTNLNYFGVKSRMSLKEWKKRGWIIGDDPRGWFQWYCRYYLGRRTYYDEKQIKRWKSFKRHLGQIKANCKKGDLNCRPRQRQALLQWAYDPFI
jgi:hypothetical protein